MIFKVPPFAEQRGLALFDSLVAILVFSVGVLALIVSLAAAVKNTSQARYRGEAAFLADQVIGQMWASDKTKLVSDFASPDAASFVKWRDEQVKTRLPGVAGSVNAPTIEIQPAGNRVVVTVRWQAPGETEHRYVSVAQICDNVDC